MPYLPFEPADSPNDRIGLDQKIALLSRPELYPERPARVEHIRTHLSWLFLTPTRVYKLKKPVRHAYRDFRSLEARRRNCEAEVRLNRRLAASVYRGTTALTLDERGQAALDGSGEIIEWLVRMRLARDVRADCRVRRSRIGLPWVRSRAAKCSPCSRCRPALSRSMTGSARWQDFPCTPASRRTRVTPAKRGGGFGCRDAKTIGESERAPTAGADTDEQGLSPDDKDGLYWLYATHAGETVMATSIARTLRLLCILLLSLFTLGGCETTTTRTSTCELAFMGTGGVLGGVLGHRLGSGSRDAVIGVGIGIAGGYLAARRACADERAIYAALDNTPDGESASWRLHQTGDDVTVTPQTTFQRDGQQCREFEMVVLVDGEPRSTTGTACRRPEDQVWTEV